MKLRTPYSLPFTVLCQDDLAASEDHISIRILSANKPSQATTRAFHSMVLPFLLLGTSGALSGADIPPWTSGISDWSQPVSRGNVVEWALTSVRLDPQAWVVLAQMMLVTHREHAIDRIEVADPQRFANVAVVETGVARFNPYPRRWEGIEFSVDFSGDISREFMVSSQFTRALSEEEQESVREDLFAWAPGLANGAYGVAPVEPDRCTGMPDEEVVFVDRELEWSISNFNAHTAALDGLVNVLAGISHKVASLSNVTIG